MKETKRSILTSCISLLLCFVMLIGTTFAWFTDIATSANNVIQAGNLDVGLWWSRNNLTWSNAEAPGAEPIFNYDRWEPGYTEVRYIKVKNDGNLSFKYQMAITPVGAVGTLAEVIDVSYDIVTGNSSFVAPSADNKQGSLKKVSTLDKLIEGNDIVVGGVLLPKGETKEGYYSEEIVICVSLHMQETAGNEYQNLSIGKGFGITVYATQFDYENDSFDSSYDDKAEWPDIPSVGNSASADVTTDANGVVTTETIISGNGMSAVVPAGVQLTSGTNKLTLSVANKDKSDANVTIEENEELRALDVHIDGIAEGNTTPIAVTLTEALPKALNMGNYTLHHVEDGVTTAMTALADGADPVHNNFTYDPATGDVTLYLASFSEVAVVAEPPKWEGNFDYSWYTNAVAPVDGESDPDYVIANADQLAAFGAIVGGMDGQERNSFNGETITLISDINIGDTSSDNGIVFYPIGYYNSEGTYERTNTAITSGLRNFEGTFDGNGHTVSNFYQNTWEMKGDHDWYSPEEQYYRDGMGLFGRVYGGTVKNLTVKNFSSDGEIATTGVIAAYADFGATFENIAIFDCNPRVYNIGNGGIVGCVGWYTKDAYPENQRDDYKVIFRNITVDNSNKISALWGSYDVACGGIVGQYYPTSGQTSAGTPKNAGIHFDNCHVSAVMDVYNDVCANYQYYAYRYTGMLIGSVRENETIDGHSYPKMDGITAEGCTVHFGDWNDYYYCELVANTTASYTHDHQMSRLTQVSSVDVGNKTVTDLNGNTTDIPTSGRVNYVVVKAKDANGMWIHGDGHDYAECYHFVDGEVWNHEDAGYHNGENGEKYIDENGDGIADLKEDKQLIYREFNNLVTGYGWGVTSKGVGDLAGVTILDRAEGNSVEKFEGKVTELANNREYKLGDIFSFVDNGVKLVPGALTVTVTNLDENNPVSATITYDRDNWENGTITFTGTGKITITIQDYYFCTPTEITVNVTERQPAEKFDVVMNNGDFLHRVGNSGTVPVDKLFKAKDGVTVGTISVTVEAVNGTPARGTYSNNAIQFNGTGVVKVTIKDDDTYCIPTELYLEVVDATNYSGASDETLNATTNNVVLLTNISSSGFTVSDGYAFYGNGFKVRCAGKGTYLNNGGLTLGYVNVQTGGTLDNVQVICDIYPNAFVYAEEVKVSNNLDEVASTTDRLRYMYQLSAIAVSGDGSVVSNCYAYGGRNNIFVGGGNVTIENTVTECGTLANIQIAGIKDTAVNTVTIKDVTTIQYKNASTYDSTKIMLGFGIVVGDNESSANPNIVLQGDLKQYNWVTSDDTSVSNTYAKTAIEGALAATQYHHTINGKTAVNMGIAYMNDKTTTFPAGSDQRTNKQEIPYAMSLVRISGQNGYVYSIEGSSIDGSNRYNAEDDGITPYNPNAQRDVVPKPVFSLGDQAVTGEDRYLTGDINGITGRYESGQNAFTLDITKLMSASKYGSACIVNAVCIDPDGNELSETVTLNKSGTYTLKFTVVDNVFYYLEGKEVVKVDKTIEYTYTVSIKLTIAEPSVPDATLTVESGSYKGSYTDSTADGSKKLSINPLNPITVTDAGADFNLTSNVKSVDISYSATGTDGNGNAFGGTTTITVTYNEGQVLKIVLAKPTSNSPGNPKSITYDSSTGTVKSSNTLKKSSCTAASWTVSSYSFTGKNGKTVTANGVTFSIDANTGGGCVTPDTLVTLADGTQKRIDQVTYEDKLLVWNHFTGKYDVAPAAIIFNHGYSENTIIKLSFSDGTVVKVANLHQFYDNDLNKFVSIDADSVAQYVGHSFAKQSGDGYTTVTLDSYEISVEYEAAYGIISAFHYNIIVEGMISTDFMLEDYDLFNYFELGEGMTFDKDQMQADIEKYGLYTYEDFADYLTYDQFVAFNVQYFKIAVGKGNYTYEGIIELINTYLNN